MNLNTYMEFCKVIWCERDGHTLRGVAIAALGLAGEAGEVTEASRPWHSWLDSLNTTRRYSSESLCAQVFSEPLYKELGDVCYYVMILADWKGLTGQDLFDAMLEIESQENHAPNLLELQTLTMRVTEPVKKWIRDGRDIEPWHLLGNLARILVTIDLLARAIGTTLGHVVQANQAKLEVRYAKTLLEAGYPRVVA